MSEYISYEKLIIFGTSKVGKTSLSKSFEKKDLIEKEEKSEKSEENEIESKS